MNSSLRSVILLTAVALPIGSIPNIVCAAIVTQNTEFAPGVPFYPRDQQGKQKEAEILFNVNVPDGNNPGKMKSIPVTVKLDPTKVKTQEDKTKAVTDAINTNADIVANNQDLKKNKRNKEQVTAKASLDTKHAPLLDILGRPIIDPKTKKPKTVPVMAWQVHTRNTVADNGPGTQPHEAHPVIVLKDTSNEPQHAVFGRPGVKPGGGGTSPGSPGSMGGKGSTSMGFHPDSTPANPIGSWVTFGYFPNEADADANIFTVFPDPGQSDYDVLMELSQGLHDLGIPASYDLSTNTLSLGIEFASNQGFWFGNTDPGLDFTVSFPLVTVIVPEPATAGLLCLASLTFLICRRNLSRLAA